MAFDLAALMNEHQGQSFDLHSQFMNPQLVKVLKTLGFDRQYVRRRGLLPLSTTGVSATSTSCPVSGSSPWAGAIR